ncbi:lipase family protein [Aspergillus thermomutatus]|uniref:feruloyl esterase n=1 Tax=Aspergillus thermomutatus TaxID=41047 RepID=A0A397HCR4_ASPTH|nr:uncharacterized protein CDV56_103448 [Aspergillus thermomutatus]RHZ59788.1 hypothetical protein CDV56_103448 [Aspergillus thermomutatus]
MAQYAMAANCRANHNGSVSTTSTCGADEQLPIYCDAGYCPDLEDADTVILSRIEHINPGDTHGYMAVDHTHETIALAFRGTVSRNNSLADIYAIYEDVTGIDGCEGCKAHAGFWDAVQAVSGCVFPKVRDAAQQYPGHRIVFTGHSLGGALATIAAAMFRQEANVDLYTFGAPSVGNYEFAKFISEQTAGDNYRITHAWDIVPSLLTRLKWDFPFLLEYSQLTPEYWITSGNGVPVTTADIHRIDGINSTDGNLGQKGTPEDHGWYMINTSVCAEV